MNASVPEEENRELTDEKAKRTDEALGTSNTPGLVDQLNDEAIRKEKIENKRRQLIAAVQRTPQKIAPLKTFLPSRVSHQISRGLSQSTESASFF